MKYIAPSKEFSEESRVNSNNNSEMQDDNYEADLSCVINEKRPVSSQCDLTAIKAEYQTDQDQKAGTVPFKFTF